MNNLPHVKADLVPYSAEYSRSVRSWINSPEILKTVCRGTDYPPSEEIIESWQREEVKSYLMFSENHPVAYAELWIKKMDLAIEIAHLIVDPAKRSRGYGTKMAELMFQRAAEMNNVAKVQVSLYGESTEALGCFLKAGFEILGTATYTTGLKLVKDVE